MPGYLFSYFLQLYKKHWVDSKQNLIISKIVEEKEGIAPKHW